MTTGVVKFWNAQKGYGMITCDHPVEGLEEGKSLFVHSSGITKHDEKTCPSLEEGQLVMFNVVQAEKGIQAQDVTDMEGNPIRAKLVRKEIENACLFGTVLHWNTAKGFGWIQGQFPHNMNQQIPKHIQEMNDGRLYFQARDAGIPRGQEINIAKGSPCMFQLYWDQKGMGARQVNIMGMNAGGGKRMNMGDGPSMKRQKIRHIEGDDVDEYLSSIKDELPLTKLQLVIPSTKVGAVIGPKGSTIQSITESANCKNIKVASDKAAGHTQYQLVDILGPPCSIAQAAKMILNVLEDTSSVTIAIANDVYGKFVGKGKAHLNDLCSKSGVTSQCVKDLQVCNGSVDGVTLRGSEELVETAIKWVVALYAPLVAENGIESALNVGGSMMGMMNGMGNMGGMMPMMMMGGGMKFGGGKSKGKGKGKGRA